VFQRFLPRDSSRLRIVIVKLYVYDYYDRYVYTACITYRRSIKNIAGDHGWSEQNITILQYVSRDVVGWMDQNKITSLGVKDGLQRKESEIDIGVVLVRSRRMPITLEISG
jgi:hypothetical protein